MNNMEQLILFTKLVETGKRLQAEGKDIFGGMFYGGDPDNIQLSYTRRGNVVDICYCFYGKMYNFTTSELVKESLKLDPNEA